MRWHRTWAIAKKETIQIKRDWRSLILAVAIPMALLLLFGFALSLDVDHVPISVWDQNYTPKSRELISQFSGSPYFQLIPPTPRNYKSIEKGIDNREILGTLIIPTNYTKKVSEGNTGDVQFIIDGTDSNTATLALNYAESIIAHYSNELLAKRLNNLKIDVPANPLDVRTRIWFNPDLDSKNTIVPGLISVIMMIISALLTSLTIAREWERGTMEQLISTPVKVTELIIGKLLPYFFIGMFDVLLVILVGQFIFHVPIKGSVCLLLTMSVIFMIGSLSLGILISIIAKSQLLASQLAMVLTFLPSFLLSGFFTSIANMPKAIQLISYLVPARYFMTLIKAIYLKGIGLKILHTEAFLLCIYTILMIIAARIAFKKKLG